MSAFDDSIDSIKVNVTLGLACWSWVLEYLPDNDTVTDEIRRQVASCKELEKSVFIRNLLLPSKKKP